MSPCYCHSPARSHSHTASFITHACIAHSLVTAQSYRCPQNHPSVHSHTVSFAQAILIPKLVKNMTSNLAKCATFIAVDMGAFMPFVYFPLFYGVQTSINLRGKLGEDTSISSSIQKICVSAKNTYSENVFSDLQYASMVMVPQDVALQMLIPPQWRVPFVSVSGVVWVGILSSRRGGTSS